VDMGDSAKRTYPLANKSGSELTYLKSQSPRHCS